MIASNHLRAPRHGEAMYREMDMRFWLNEAEAEMKALPQGPM
jgi:hypothetical protein